MSDRPADATREAPRRHSRSATLIAASAVLAAGLAVALLAGELAPHDPLQHNLEHRLEPPGATFLLGTDNFGRDVLSRVLHGARVSLLVGLASVVVVTIVGTALGVASAYLGGRADLYGQRVVDALLAFPALVVVLTLVAAFGPSAVVVVVGIVVALTPQMTRLARAQALRAREHEYVIAAEAMGASHRRVMLRHILPDSLPPVLVLATGHIGEAMVLEAALSFLGLGVPPPHPSWGRMISEGAQLYLETAPWLTIVPGLALSILVLGFAFLGDALRDALDPHRVRAPRG